VEDGERIACKRMLGKDIEHGVREGAYDGRWMMRRRLKPLFYFGRRGYGLSNDGHCRRVSYLTP
jgi:hypothetical protein